MNSPMKGAGVAELRDGRVLELWAVLALCVVVGVDSALEVVRSWPAASVGVASG